MTAGKLASQYRKLPLPMKAAMWFAVCQFLRSGINFLTSPFIARMLPLEEYGRVGTFNAWESIFLVFVTFSSPHVVMNLCVRSDDRERMLSGLMGYNVIVSAIWGAVLLLAIGVVARVTGLSRTLIVCMYLCCVYTVIINCWTYYKHYVYSYRVVVAESLLFSLGTSIGSLASVYFISRTAEARIIPQVITGAIIGTVLLVAVFRSGKVFCNRDVWKYTFFFCVPLIPHYLSEIVLMSCDRIMIDHMCGTTSVAIYNVAYSVGSLITLMTSAVNYAFTPYQYHKINSKEYDALAKSTDYIMAFIAVCLCMIMLFSREIVLMLGGNKYIDSVSLIIPISVGVYFNNMFQLFARIQEYFEQKHTIVIASISCAVLNVVLNHIFIALFGYKAAAYTTFVCYFVFCFLHYLFYRIACKKFVGREIYDVKGLVLISSVLILAAVLISFIGRLFILKYMLLIFTGALLFWKRRALIGFAESILKKE